MTNKLTNDSQNFKMQFRTSKELTKEECELLLQKDDINSTQLEQLISAKKENIIHFNLVDVREWVEWVGSRIKHADYLIPTTSFYEKLKQIENDKETPCVVYCHVGQRSAYCQKVMRDLGFKTVANLANGIAAYEGETVSGQ